MGSCICRNILENDDNLSNSQLRGTLQRQSTSQFVSSDRISDIIDKLVNETLTIIASIVDK